MFWSSEIASRRGDWAPRLQRMAKEDDQNLTSFKSFEFQQFELRACFEIRDSKFGFVLMHPWYRFCRFLFRVYFRIYHRGRIHHRERLPDEGAFILAGNHVSFLDPPFFGQACRREAFYMARDTLFRNPIANWILKSWNCVPISRDRGDIGAMRTVLRLLGEGKAVLMFPEGTRSLGGELQEARAGVGMIVAKARVPIVPVRIFGTDRALPKGASMPRPARVEIRFGEPFTYPFPPNFDELRGDALKAVYFDIGREIMRRIAELTG